MAQNVDSSSRKQERMNALLKMKRKQSYVPQHKFLPLGQIGNSTQSPVGSLLLWIDETAFVLARLSNMSVSAFIIFTYFNNKVLN